MYQTYKDIVEFRLVYIREAHAADGDRPNELAIDLGINEHETISDRCTTAEMLMKDKKLTIPCIIDGMDNKVAEAYRAHPDRIFVVRTSGDLAVAAARGPRGFKPGLDATLAWLRQYRQTGVEPDPIPVKEPEGPPRGRRPGDANR